MKLTKRDWKQGLATGLALLTAVMMTACDPKGTAARNQLGWLLDNNPDMTAEALLDSLEHLNGVTPDFSVHLPVTSADTRPLSDMEYVNPVTGSQLVFHLNDTIDDPFAIGTVTISQKSGSQPLGELGFYKADSIYVEAVHAWGKGIYTAFVRDTITDDDGSTKERIFHKEYLMFVYPGGDSILTTQGFKDSENIFKLKK